MTTPEGPELVDRIDREAAADLSPSLYNPLWSPEIEQAIREGKRDTSDLVQAFARHRHLALSQSDRSAVLEEAARCAEGCDLPKRDWMPQSLYATIRREVAAQIRKLKDRPDV